MKKVSIIIPVYNTKQYIGECLTSVINQTYTNLEIICVNDNSDDNSLEVLEGFKKNDSRISIINFKKNAGPGYARNEAIKRVTCEYLLFIDSDDYIDRNTINTLIASKKLNDVDILIYDGKRFGYNTVEMNENKYFYLEEFFFENYTIKNQYIQYIANFHSPCMKIYKTSFIKENNIRFPVSIVGEDVEFWLKCLLQKPKIDYLDYVGYHRRYRKDSIMNHNITRNLRDRLSNFNSILNICKGEITLYNYVLKSYMPFTIRKVYKTEDEALIEYAHLIYKELINNIN